MSDQKKRKIYEFIVLLLCAIFAFLCVVFNHFCNDMSRVYDFIFCLFSIFMCMVVFYFYNKSIDLQDKKYSSEIYNLKFTKEKINNVVDDLLVKKYKLIQNKIKNDMIYYRYRKKSLFFTYDDVVVIVGKKMNSRIVEEIYNMVEDANNFVGNTRSVKDMYLKFVLIFDKDDDDISYIFDETLRLRTKGLSFYEKVVSLIYICVEKQFVQFSACDTTHINELTYLKNKFFLKKILSLLRKD